MSCANVCFQLKKFYDLLSQVFSLKIYSGRSLYYYSEDEFFLQILISNKLFFEFQITTKIGK